MSEVDRDDNLPETLRYLLQQRKLEAEVAEELETHRLMAEQRDLANGETCGCRGRQPPRHGQRHAGAGGRARAWIAPWLDSIWQDGLYALRMIRRAPAFTGAFVLVMALGVGATTAVFALVDSLMLRDLPVPAGSSGLVRSPSFSYPIFRR